MQLVSVFNQSSVVSDDELTAIINAINTVSMPAFGQHWPQGELTTYRPAGAWAMWILDTTDQPGDMAYHLDQAGMPLIKVFAATIKSYGASLCQAIDHELKESLGDPTAAQTIRIPGGIIVKENCDPVSGDGIDLGNGLTGSNFVFPSWFDINATGPYDYLGECTKPLEVRPGGYKEELRDGASQWVLSAMRDANGLHNWRLGHHGRLTYRAKHR